MPVGDRRSSPALFHNRRRWQGAASLALVSRFRAMPVGDRRSSPALFHNRRRWQGAASSALVSRFRAMPVGDRRSSRALSQSLTLAGGGVIGAGFALPRDAGRRPALQPRSFAIPDVGRGRRHRRWFRAPARCRSETGAPAPRSFTIGDVGRGRRHWRWFRAPARCRSETGAPAALFHNPWRWQGAASLALVSRSRAMPVGDRRSSPALSQSLTLARGGVIGAGFALPRDAGRRPALQLSQSATLAWGGVIGAGFALPRDAGRRPALQLSQSLTLAWGGVIGAGFALPRDAGRRPALQLSQSAVRGFTSPRTQKAQRQPERRANCGPSTSRWPGHWLQITPRRNSPSGSGRFHCAARSS